MFVIYIQPSEFPTMTGGKKLPSSANLRTAIWKVPRQVVYWTSGMILAV